MTVLPNIRTNPYIGPREFKTGETLYGRDREVVELVDLLIAERIVLLYAPSGAGKSSLIRAKLIPELEQEGFKVYPVIRLNAEPLKLGRSSDQQFIDTLIDPQQSYPANFFSISDQRFLDWLIDVEQALPVRSDDTICNRYLLSVLQSLEEYLPMEKRTPLPKLADLRLDEYMASRMSVKDQSVDEVLIFDQFEEILTIDPTDHAAKIDFFIQLGRTLQNRHRWALFAMREDYIASLDAYLRMIPTHLSNTFRLDFLTVDAARQAVKRPAQDAKVTFTDAATEHLLKDLGTIRVQDYDGTIQSQPGLYIEPVQLQVVCRRLWDRLPATSDCIEEADVVALGNVDDALADYYTERVKRAVEATHVTERSLRSWVNRHLITAQGTRGQVMKGIGQTQGLDNRAIKVLVDAHLVRAEPRLGTMWYELAHDRLIKPIRDSNAAWEEANMDLVQRWAKLWANQGKPAHLLLTGQVLVDAETWAAGLSDDELSPIEQDFLEESRAAQDNADRARQRKRLIQLGVLTVAAVVAALYFFVEARRQSQIVLSQKLVTQALNYADDRLDLATLLGLEAYQLVSDRETAASLHTVLEHNLHLNTFLRDHTQTVESVVFSPDGKYLASGSADKTIILRDLTTANREQRRLTGHTDAVLSVAFSPDSKTLVSGSVDGTVRLWDVQSGQQVGKSLVGHAEHVLRVAFSPDGRTVASGGKDAAIVLWDIGSFQQIGHALTGHTKGIWGLAFSPDGSLLASGSEDTTVRLWNVKTQASSGEPLRDHHRWVRSVAFSPDGRTLASGSGNRDIILWDVQTRLPSGGPLLGHTGSVLSVAFSPDGKMLASGGTDRTLRLWDVQSRQPLGTPYKGHLGWIWSVAFSPDKNLWASGSDDATVILWSMEAQPRLSGMLKGHSAYVANLAFSPDSRILAAGDDSNKIILWDMQEHSQFKVLIGHRKGLRSVAFSPDGKTLLSAGIAEQGFPSIMLWDTATGQPLAPLPEQPLSDVNSATFSTDGRMIAASGDCIMRNKACTRSEVRLWDAQTHESLPSLIDIDKDGVGSVWSLAFSPKDTFLAAGIGDRAIVVWDLDAQQPVARRLNHNGYVSSLAFSPDGKYLASGSVDGTIILWDTTTYQPIGPRRVDHSGPVYSVAFSPDSKGLASSSADGLVVLWDIATSQQLGPAFRIDGSGVRTVTFSPNGQQLAAGNDNGRISVWDLSIESWQEHACKLVGRNLTQDEWKQHLGGRPYRETCRARR